MDVSTNLATPGRVLAIGAHPDDIELGCGATLAKWAATGAEIVHLVCTDGSKGSWDPSHDTVALVASRQEEQREASRRLGGSGEVVFLGWPDGELVSGVRQRWEVAYWIRRVRPDVVLGHDPWQRWRLHPDHRNAGFLATDGIVAARDPHFFPEHSIPHHRPSALLLWETEEPNHVEDVEGFDGAKVEALLAHRTQWRSTMGIDPDGATVVEQTATFRDWVVAHLGDHGRLAGFTLGEAFRLIDRL